MSCERCKDIHKAQVEGRTQRECGCSCHNRLYTGTNTASTTGTITLDAGSCDATENNIFTTNIAGDTSEVGTW